MEVKNLFEPAVKQEIEDRINKLTLQSQPKWGKMNVAQMLAHLQEPMAIALDGKTVKANWLMKMIFPLFKSKLWDDQPYKQNLPTSPSFITYGSEKDFENEKQGLLNMVNRFTETNIISSAGIRFLGNSPKKTGAKLPGNISIITCSSLVYSVSLIFIGKQLRLY